MNRFYAALDRVLATWETEQHFDQHDTFEELARAFIRRDVERGLSVSEIAGHNAGFYSQGFSIVVGATIDAELLAPRLGSKAISVKFDGHVHVFPLAQIVEQVELGIHQPSLIGLL